MTAALLALAVALPAVAGDKPQTYLAPIRKQDVRSLEGAVTDKHGPQTVCRKIAGNGSWLPHPGNV